MGVNIFIKYLWINLKAAAEFRGDFIFSNVYMVVHNSVFYATILSLAHAFDGIGVFTFEKLLFAFAIGQGAYMVGINFFTGIIQLQDWIITGDLDKLLIRPVSAYTHIITNRINHSAIGELVWFFIFLGLNPLTNWGYIFLFAILGGIMFHCVTLALGMIPLFVEMNQETPFFELIINFLIYPPDIYNSFIKFFAMYVFPGAMVAFVPILALTQPNLYFTYAITFAGIIVITLLMYHFGFRGYRSAGY